MSEIPGNVVRTTQTITEDLKCTRCGYNLRGLTPDKLCPECGTPIGQSVQGNLLRYADPVWVNRLRLGSALLLGAVCTGVVSWLSSDGVGFLLGLADVPLLQGFRNLLNLIVPGLALWALVLVTTPEPTVAFKEDRITLRRAVRGCAPIWCVGQIVYLAWKFPAEGALVSLVGGMLGLASLVVFFGQFILFRRFALRIPNVKLARATTIVMWGFPLLALGAPTVAGIGLGIAGASGLPGPGVVRVVAVFALFYAGLVAPAALGIWYGVLLFRYYAGFKTAVVEARQGLATTSSAPSR